MLYKLKSLVGQNCITQEDGQRVYELIHCELVAGNSVELDFAGADVFASPFFNAAIGQLLRDIPSEKLNKSLELLNLNQIGDQLVRRVIENSKIYYSQESVRKAIDEVMTEEAEKV